MIAAESTRQRGRPVGPVAPILPISLLEAMRDHDRPREVLEDEDLTASLPRRLGLTGVVETQIQRYREEDRKGRDVSGEEVLHLLRLVLRRPDAEPILRETGAKVARHFFGRLPSPAVSALRVLPAAALAAALRRSTRKLLRKVSGGHPEVAGRPVVIRVDGALSVDDHADGTSCVLFTAALEEMAFLFTGMRHRAEQIRCQARGEACCEWILEP